MHKSSALTLLKPNRTEVEVVLLGMLVITLQIFALMSTVKNVYNTNSNVDRNRTNVMN